MTTTLRFHDHEEFHKAALFMAIGGGLGGLAAHLLSSGASPWRVVIVAGAAAAGIVLAAGGLGKALTGLRGRRLLVALAVGAGVFLLARHVLGSIAGARELAELPRWLVATTAGIGFALVSVVALLPRHVHFSKDRVGDAFGAIRRELNGEVRDLSQRGFDLWRLTEGQLAEGDPSRSTLEDAVLRLLETARRWQSVEAAQPHTVAADLVKRMDELDARIEKTGDAVAKKQYQQARAALAEQLRYLEGIGTQRERVLARMHAYLAAMEQLRMAVVNLESTAAASELAPLLSDLEEMGREVEDCAKAAHAL